HLHTPADVAIVRVQRDHPAVAGADRYRSVIRTRTACQRGARSCAPQLAPVRETERGNIAAPPRCVHPVAVDRGAEAEPQALTLATDTRAPRALHAKLRGKIRKLGRRIDLFLFRATDERAKRQNT